MLPELAVNTPRVVEQKDVVVPGPSVSGSMNGTRLRGISPIAEFRVVALAAQRAHNP
jgi:hypothetical protein